MNGDDERRHNRSDGGKVAAFATASSRQPEEDLPPTNTRQQYQGTRLKRELDRIMTDLESRGAVPPPGAAVASLSATLPTSSPLWRIAGSSPSYRTLADLEADRAREGQPPALTPRSWAVAVRSGRLPPLTRLQADGSSQAAASVRRDEGAPSAFSHEDELTEVNEAILEACRLMAPVVADPKARRAVYEDSVWRQVLRRAEDDDDTQPRRPLAATAATVGFGDGALVLGRLHQLSLWYAACRRCTNSEDQRGGGGGGRFIVSASSVPMGDVRAFLRPSHVADHRLNVRHGVGSPERNAPARDHQQHYHPGRGDGEGVAPHETPSLTADFLRVAPPPSSDGSMRRDPSSTAIGYSVLMPREGVFFHTWRSPALARAFVHQWARVDSAVHAATALTGVLSALYSALFVIDAQYVTCTVLPPIGGDAAAVGGSSERSSLSPVDAALLATLGDLDHNDRQVPTHVRSLPELTAAALECVAEITRVPVQEDNREGNALRRRSSSRVGESQQRLPRSLEADGGGPQRRGALAVFPSYDARCYLAGPLGIPLDEAAIAMGDPDDEPRQSPTISFSSSESPASRLSQAARLARGRVWQASPPALLEVQYRVATGDLAAKDATRVLFTHAKVTLAALVAQEFVSQVERSNNTPPSTATTLSSRDGAKKEGQRAETTSEVAIDDLTTLRAICKAVGFKLSDMYGVLVHVDAHSTSSSWSRCRRAAATTIVMRTMKELVRLQLSREFSAAASAAVRQASTVKPNTVPASVIRTLLYPFLEAPATGSDVALVASMRYWEDNILPAAALKFAFSHRGGTKTAARQQQPGGTATASAPSLLCFADVDFNAVSSCLHATAARWSTTCVRANPRPSMSRDAIVPAMDIDDPRHADPAFSKDTTSVSAHITQQRRRAMSETTGAAPPPPPPPASLDAMATTSATTTGPTTTKHVVGPISRKGTASSAGPPPLERVLSQPLSHALHCEQFVAAVAAAVWLQSVPPLPAPSNASRSAASPSHQSRASGLPPMPPHHHHHAAHHEGGSARKEGVTTQGGQPPHRWPAAVQRHLTYMASGSSAEQCFRLAALGVLVAIDASKDDHQHPPVQPLPAPLPRSVSELLLIALANALVRRDLLAAEEAAAERQRAAEAAALADSQVNSLASTLRTMRTTPPSAAARHRRPTPPGGATAAAASTMASTSVRDTTPPPAPPSVPTTSRSAVSDQTMVTALPSPVETPMLIRTLISDMLRLLAIASPSPTSSSSTHSPALEAPPAATALPGPFAPIQFQRRAAVEGRLRGDDGGGHHGDQLTLVHVLATLSRCPFVGAACKTRAGSKSTNDDVEEPPSHVWAVPVCGLFETCLRLCGGCGEGGVGGATTETRPRQSYEGATFAAAAIVRSCSMRSLVDLIQGLAIATFSRPPSATNLSSAALLETGNTASSGSPLLAVPFHTEDAEAFRAVLRSHVQLVRHCRWAAAVLRCLDSQRCGLQCHIRYSVGLCGHVVRSLQSRSGGEGNSADTAAALRFAEVCVEALVMQAETSAAPPWASSPLSASSSSACRPAWWSGGAAHPLPEPLVPVASLLLGMWATMLVLVLGYRDEDASALTDVPLALRSESLLHIRTGLAIIGADPTNNRAALSQLGVATAASDDEQSSLSDADEDEQVGIRRRQGNLSWATYEWSQSQLQPRRRAERALVGGEGEVLGTATQPPTPPFGAILFEQYNCHFPVCPTAQVHRRMTTTTASQPPLPPPTTMTLAEYIMDQATSRTKSTITAAVIRPWLGVFEGRGTTAATTTGPSAVEKTPPTAPTPQGVEKPTSESDAARASRQRADVARRLGRVARGFDGRRHVALLRWRKSDKVLVQQMLQRNRKVAEAEKNAKAAEGVVVVSTKAKRHPMWNVGARLSRIPVAPIDAVDDFQRRRRFREETLRPRNSSDLTQRLRLREDALENAAVGLKPVDRLPRGDHVVARFGPAQDHERSAEAAASSSSLSTSITVYSAPVFTTRRVAFEAELRDAAMHHVRSVTEPWEDASALMAPCESGFALVAHETMARRRLEQELWHLHGALVWATCQGAIERRRNLEATRREDSFWCLEELLLRRAERYMASSDKEKLKQHRAARTVQCAWRSFRARFLRRFETLSRWIRHRQRFVMSAVLTLQRFARRSRAVKRMQRLEHVHTAVAAVLDAAAEWRSSPRHRDEA